MEKQEKREMSPIELTLVATSRMVGAVGTSCGVVDRCRSVRTTQVSCCCTVPHYSANSCEKHVSTAARKIVQNGCEVKVARIYTNGEDHKLFEGRREKSSRLAQYEQFLVEMLGMLAEDAKKPPTTDDYPDPTEHLKAVVRYAYADLLRDRIERFRNSLGKR